MNSPLIIAQDQLDHARRATGAAAEAVCRALMAGADPLQTEAQLGAARAWEAECNFRVQDAKRAALLALAPTRRGVRLCAAVERFLVSRRNPLRSGWARYGELGVRLAGVEACAEPAPCTCGAVTTWNAPQWVNCVCDMDEPSGDVAAAVAELLDEVVMQPRGLRRAA